jgi:hypothetical protein
LSGLELRLFLLTRSDPQPGEVGQQIVCARSSDAARRLAGQKAGPEGKHGWMHIDGASCVELVPSGEPRVLMLAVTGRQP